MPWSETVKHDKKNGTLSFIVFNQLKLAPQIDAEDGNKITKKAALE